MHVSHRNAPGNGHWPNSMSTRGQGAASRTRISPEGSVRGHRNISDYRNNKRAGFGRGSHFKQFQQPMLPFHETDIFMEAGRLAAEYLVSKGVLPSNALSGKWQNGGLKNQIGEFQGFRPHNIDNPQVLMDGRTSAHARLGNASLDVGSVRRRSSIDSNSLGSRNFERDRRRAGSFKNYGSEVNRVLGKSESWGERSSASFGIEVDSDGSARHHDGQPPRKDGDADGGTQTLSPRELARDGGTVVHLQSELEKPNPVETISANSSSSVSEKYLPSDVKEESIKASDDDDRSNAEVQMVNEGKNDAAFSKKLDENVEVPANVSEDTSLSKGIVDLVKHFNSAKVPTKPRSSLTINGSKANRSPINREENIIENGLSVGSTVHVIDNPHEGSADNVSSHQIHELSSLDTHVETTLDMDKELEVTCRTGPVECSRSRSFQERYVYKEEEKVDEGQSVFGSSNSMFIDRGRKRVMDDDADGREGFKKNREWEPVNTESDGCLPLSSSMEIQPTSEEARISQCIHAASSPDEKTSNISLFPGNHGESCELTEEKRLFSGSFKTCDLNLIGTSDTHENHDGERLFNFPSIIQTGKELSPIDVGLSMSNSCDVPYKNAEVVVNNNEIEVIDLENDSAPEDQTFSYPERRPNSVFTDLDGFPNNVNNVNEIPDVQDGYGLMFSELLGNSSPNCSVPADLNSLHNAMGLPNAEGILGDDDSIYMSLGEIPISFLRAWEQPTQDYGKPF